MWTLDLYNEFINNLFNLSDKKYLNFSKKLVINSKEMIGVNIPNLRKIAKKIANTDFESFLSYYQGKYFEETLVYGLTLGYLKDKNKLKKYLTLYSEEITDWSLCDTPATNMKLISKNQKEFLPYIKKLLSSKKEFPIRFGLILLLSQYLNDDYINFILDTCINLKSDSYYVNMAISWLLCECYIKYQNKTDQFISSEYLDKFVLNKTISKISDSYRVSLINKENLKKRRI